MPPKLALLAVFGLIVWLFMKERKSRGPVSAALWLPLTWAFIIGSKPVSMWLNGGDTALDTTVDYLEGSPLDRMVLFSLIAAGLLVVLHRRESLINIILSNKWVFAFYLYLGISVLWSDYSFVSFKRWIKDFGNVIMALVILSEANPREAFKSVLLRCSILLLPLSVVVIKYFPDIARYYDRWNYTVYYSGVSGDKNLLGMALFVSGAFLFHLFLESRKQAPEDTKRLPAQILAGLVLMDIWLLLKARSATAIVCTIFCAFTLFVLHRYGAKKLVVYGLIFAGVLVLISSVFNIAGLVGTVLDRDTTLTGRTDIWRKLLDENVNPLVGVGFYSFWLGERTQSLFQKYHYPLNEAHNGYLELYLNSGLIGLFLLFALMGASIRSQWAGLKRAVPGAAFRFSFLIGTLIYNITEATFNRLSIIWFTFLLIVVVYPRPHEEIELSDAAEDIPAPATPGSQGPVPDFQ